MSLNVCRCCMARPPDKDLKAQYTRKGKTVVYGDMLKECFEIQIFLNESDEGGICELCEMKLADANDFKLQVQKCQKNMQKLAAAAAVKVEKMTPIKQEANIDDHHDDDDDDEGNDIYFLDVKEESDFEMREDADDDKNLAELFPESVKKDKKKPAVLKKSNDVNKSGQSSSGIKKTQPAKTYSSSKVRSNIDNIMKYSNATPFLTITRSGIVCSFCTETLKDINVLKTHINDAHKNKIVTNYGKKKEYSACFKVDITDLKCKICDKSFDIISNLKNHLIEDHNIKFYTDVFDYFCEFKLTTDKIINCVFCVLRFNSFVALLQHMHSHYRNHTCSKCDAGYIHKQALKSHVTKIHLNKQDSMGQLPKPTKAKSKSSKVRHNIENILKYSNCTPFSTKSLIGITCAFCEINVNHILDMKTHITQVHKETSLFDIRITDINSFVFKVDTTDLTCNICDAKFNFVSNLKEHLSKVHAILFFTDVNDYFVEFKLTSNEIFTCVFCNSNYETFKSLQQHLSKHYSNHFCDICGASFITKQAQRRHRRCKHSTSSYKCSVCSKVFSNKESKKNHDRVVHKKESRFQSKCPLCNATFNDYYQRNQHLINQHKTKAAVYKCNACDKTFVLKAVLTQHIRKDHLMEKNNVCSHCGSRFFDKEGLKKHLAKHENKIYQCGLCSKAYSRKKILSAHMKVHNDERIKRFKCGICYSEFHHKVSLKSHMVSKHEMVEYEFFETVDDDDK